MEKGQLKGPKLSKMKLAIAMHGSPELSELQEALLQESKLESQQHSAATGKSMDMDSQYNDSRHTYYKLSFFTL